MAEELKDLIAKIQHDGVVVAQEKAREIENEARQEADSILSKAKSDAGKIIVEAKERVAKMEEAGRLSLKQAGRDTVITLKKEICAMLDRVIKSAIEEALTSHELTKVISALIKDYGQRHKEGIEISLKREDIGKIENGLLSELKEEAKKGITLKASDEISAGFLISFDKGKSHFDFTEGALAEYLGSYLKPKIAETLK